MMTTNNELLILRKQLGRAIAQLRTEANLSVRELSARCGIHYTSINKLEKGNYNASIDIINTILITLKSQLTMEKRNYTIELEEDKVEYLRNLDSEYIYNEEDDSYYKPTYELTYDYAENYNREFIAEYDNLDEALANITRRGDEKSNEYYAPTTILGIKLEICYKDEDGDIIETGEYLRNCEISGTPIENWFLGECRFTPLNEISEQGINEITTELNEWIPIFFNSLRGEIDEEDIYFIVPDRYNIGDWRDYIEVKNCDDEFKDKIRIKLESYDGKIELIIQTLYSESKFKFDANNEAEAYITAITNTINELYNA